MNEERTGVPRGHTEDQSAALESLAAAHARVAVEDTHGTRRLLHQAVDAARDAGVGWTRIGDTLGIASGNAYQRYRRRPHSNDPRVSQRPR